jgi:hypothetical protein
MPTSGSVSNVSPSPGTITVTAAPAGAYLGLDGQDDLGQDHNEALEGHSDVLEYEICNPHDPQQVEEIQRLQVGLQGYKAGGRGGGQPSSSLRAGSSAALPTHLGAL